MLTSYVYRKGKPIETGIPRDQMMRVLGEKDALLWVDLENPNDFESDCLVEIFNFHHLAIEDCISDASQPKVDDYQEYIFMVVNAVCVSSGNGEPKGGLKAVELNIFLGKNYVVTYHKPPIHTIDHVRDTLKKNGEFIMGHGADMLVHGLLDRLVDDYQPVLNNYDEQLDAMEESILGHLPPSDCIAKALQLKRDIFGLRRIVAPMRDMISNLTRNPTPFIKDRHMIYFRDIYDHLFRIYGSIEGCHELLTGILQVYFSASSQKLNEIMKRMTILATLTMPSVMIAGIYGMNFRHMPELDHPLGYFLALGFMAVTSIGMLIWMKWKKWI